jgi:hypothetical protein
MLSSLAYFIKSCDFFGETFTFKIKRNKYYTSIVGGATTIAFILFSLYYFFFSFSDFLSKNDRSISSEIKTVYEPIINFNDHKYFVIAFCLRDKTIGVDSYLLKNTNMSVSLINNSIQEKRLKSVMNSISFEKCNDGYFSQTEENIFDLKDFDGCKCVNMTNHNIDNIGLRSKYDVIDKDYINFQLSPNNNVNLSEFNNYLRNSNSRLFVYFPSYSVEMYNLTNPLKYNLQTQVYQIRPNTQQVASIQMSVLNFSDYASLYDEGI